MIENQIHLDTSLFFYSIVLGFLCGLYYELFRFIRLITARHTFFVFWEDLFFFLPLTGIFLIFTFAFSDGVVRWFSVAGLGIGFSLYLKTLGKMISFFSIQILRFLKVIFKFLYSITISPLWFVLKKVTNSLFTKFKILAIIRKKKREVVRLRKQKELLLCSAKKGFSTNG